jgi:hypothetical protein
MAASRLSGAVLWGLGGAQSLPGNRLKFARRVFRTIGQTGKLSAKAGGKAAVERIRPHGLEQGGSSPFNSCPSAGAERRLFSFVFRVMDLAGLDAMEPHLVLAGSDLG